MYNPRPEPERARDLLTSREVAKRLSISVRTLWRLLARGSLPPPIRYNRKLVRWRTSDIERYVAALATAAAAPVMPPPARGA
jgi:excisionase family DNA binding protein